MMPNQPFEEPKNEMLSVKVALTLKQEIELEAQTQGITVSDYLRTLIDNRHAITGLSNFEGYLVELPPSLKDRIAEIVVETNERAEDLIFFIVKQWFIYQDDYRLSNTDQNQDNVNPNQSTGLQRVTNVYGRVNNGVNVSNRENTNENPFRVNDTKRIDELVLPLIVTLKIPMLLQNFEKVVEISLEQRSLWGKRNPEQYYEAFYENFTQEEIQYLEKIGGISHNN